MSFKGRLEKLERSQKPCSVCGPLHREPIRIVEVGPRPAPPGPPQMIERVGPSHCPACNQPLPVTVIEVSWPPEEAPDAWSN
jgi:hypothetical protein